MNYSNQSYQKIYLIFIYFKIHLSNLPLEYLEKLEPEVFIAKFSTLGNIFQPDEEEIKVITELIT